MAAWYAHCSSLAGPCKKTPQSDRRLCLATCDAMRLAGPVAPGARVVLP